MSGASEAGRREPYDVCVIGAGPGGFAAAMRAHDLGKRVLLVEKGRVGGAGLHAGALSSKTMWHLSNDYAGACRTDRGYRARDVEVSYRAVMGSVRAAVREREELLTRQLAGLATPDARGGVVDLRRGAARFLSPHAISVTDADGHATRYEATNFVVATGSHPRVPEGITVDGHRVVTSDQIEDLPGFPESLVVVGAGVVGCEYATVFGNFGRTRINIIDRQPRILPFEDADVAEVVAASFANMGITVHRESRLVSLALVDDHVEYVIAGPSGEEQRLKVERALISVGRAPNTANLGLEAIGVTLEKHGGIAVEGSRSVTVPHIYAAGDTTMDVALVNVAELEGRHAVERMFGLDPKPLRYEALSAIYFLRPEVAAVGLNETQAKRRGVPYRVSVLHNRLICRNIAMRSTDGFIKLLASRDEPGRVLGLRVVGPQASSTIQGIAFLIDHGATIEDIDHCVHPHPAITEGVQECARLLLGRSVNKVDVFGLDYMRCGEG
ncbi:MAG: NAD(P)/FAD-dependent oxidoreductase [Myxococcales bacterium]|nr:NAD(P)/FAD-dependent oxidoreductase [Myxococcales bacterium]